MSGNMWESFPPQATEDQLEYLVQTVKDWTIYHGLTVRPNPTFVSNEANPNHVLATNAPVTLYPSPFPRKLFQQAQHLQKTYNELYVAIASDEEWLGEIMKELVEVDDFLANLWKIHLQVKEEGYVQDLSLGMFRSDYMINLPDDNSGASLKQVEFNTISSSFGGLATRVTQLHTELASFPNPGQSLAYPPHPLFNPSSTINSAIPSSTDITGLPPPNLAVSTLTSALKSAHTAYGSSKHNPPLPTCIIFLVQDNERNLFDQIALSSTLKSIPTFRLSTSKILSQTTIPSASENPNRPLLYHPPANPTQPYEVSIVYFRALYAPSEYNTPTSWAARHHLERSAAIKCPTVLLQLAGSKKVQQVLTNPSTLDRFLPNKAPELLSSLRSSFAPQYSMSDGPDSEGPKIALDPTLCQNHVLKPQREGGGNNIYRDNIPGFLKSIPEREYKQYILMELIQPPRAARNTVLRSDGAVITGDVISELGIFGTCLWKSTTGKGVNEVLVNEEGGYLMRTKARDSDEGGVAAGFSSLDSLVLFDE